MARLLAALAESATDPRVLALFAAALYAWPEAEVRGVLAASLPLAGALARPALPAPNTVAAGAFAACSLLAYGLTRWLSWRKETHFSRSTRPARVESVRVPGI